MNNLEATPPDFVWGNVEKEISVSKNNKKPFFYYSTAAVLLLLMAALTFYFLNSREQIESNLNHEEGNSSSVSVQDSIALEVNNKAAKDSLYIKENIPSDVSTPLETTIEQKRKNVPAEIKTESVELKDNVGSSNEIRPNNITKSDKKIKNNNSSTTTIDTFAPVVNSKEIKDVTEDSVDIKKSNKTIIIVETDTVDIEEHIFE